MAVNTNSATTAEQIERLNQTKTLVGLFKANYKTQPDLAVAAYQTIAAQLASASNFLYRDQVIAIGLARFDPALVFDLIATEDNDSNGNTLPYLYDVYQAALSNPIFQQATVAFFAQGRSDNLVYQALTATPDTALGQFLAGQLPADFLSNPYWLNLSLVLRLDGIWLAVAPSPIDQAVLGEVDGAELTKLNQRAAGNSDLVSALATFGLLDWDVYAAYVLLTAGSTAYYQLLQNNPQAELSAVAVLMQISAWLEDKKITLKPDQWSGIITTLITAGTVPRSLLDLVLGADLTSLVVLTNYNDTIQLDRHGMTQLDIKLTLAKGLSSLLQPRTDLTAVMAKFQLTEADLTAALTLPAQSRYYLAKLLPWYSGSNAVLSQFLVTSVTEPYTEEGHGMVSPWLYLAAIAANLTVPAHQWEVVTIETTEAAMVAYWYRRNYPKKVPVNLVEFAEDLLFALRDNQSIVEDYRGDEITFTGQVNSEEF